MKTNKTLLIYGCCFNLPDNFNGTLGDALMLMANKAKQAEAYNEINVCCDEHGDLYSRLINNDKIKCSIQYEIINES